MFRTFIFEKNKYFNLDVSIESIITESTDDFRFSLPGIFPSPIRQTPADC